MESGQILHPFRCCAPHVHAALDGAWMDFPMACCAEQILSMEKKTSLLVIQAII